MNAILSVLILLINLYLFALIVHIAIEYLVRFGITSYSNQIVAQIRTVTSALIEPALDRIRRFLPHFNGIDFSPLVLFLILYFVRALIQLDIMPGVGG